MIRKSYAKANQISFTDFTRHTRMHDAPVLAAEVPPGRAHQQELRMPELEMPADTVRGENGALAFSTSGSRVLDLFFELVPHIEPEEVERLLDAAWGENAADTLKLIFQTGNSRVNDAGKMDRENFYLCLMWLWRRHQRGSDQRSSAQRCYVRGRRVGTAAARCLRDTVNRPGKVSAGQIFCFEVEWAVRPRGTRRIVLLHKTDLDAAAADGSATPERVVVSRCLPLRPVV